MTSKRPNKDELKELAGPSSSSSECEHDDDDSIDRDGAGEDDESVEDEWKHDADDEYSADELGRARESCSEDGNSDREVAGGSGGQEKPSARERRRTTTKRKTVHGGAKKKKKEKDPYAFILGTWDPDVDDAAAFDKYLAQMGIGWMERKVGINAHPVITFSKDPDYKDYYLMRIETKARTITNSFTPGEEYAEMDTIDGRKVFTSFRFKGKTMKVKEKPLEAYLRKANKAYYTFKKDTMIAEYECEEVKAKRTFVKRRKPGEKSTSSSSSDTERGQPAQTLPELEKGRFGVTVPPKPQ